ncbi:MAG: Gfo/Idh/MocA family oxidoreductase [Bacteroidales bacterium]|nr:Gfo/Idh/MocA family oxidoreductase [Bacteroidales bacterium]
MYNALLIGCGNIGARYDLSNESILTHAKALYLNPAFNLTVFDINKKSTEEICNKYKCNAVDNINKKTLSNFDCVSICTPTPTHLEFLKKAIQANVKVVICEKPVSYVPEELKIAKSIYSKGNSKVLVNYFRRFQPSYSRLKKTILNLLKKEKLTNISIRYHRGFINNCSHAFDLVEYLTDSEIELDEIKKYNSKIDFSKDDQTVSMQAMWKKTNMNILGLTEVKFSHFEIDLYFSLHKISIKDAGKTVEILNTNENKSFLQPLTKEENEFSGKDCIKDYMKNVIGYAHQILEGKNTKDNFIRSVEMNERMIKYINN